jgi:uncharacterized protein YyaL (SSP411 family)
MTVKEGRKPNRLINEKSPYLLQHAYNPVDWYPWGEEAFNKAKTEDKPIFLSIGYSTCHWCHVMERESFEDDEVAKILNEGFVSIKVDREERPDIDHIYMEVCQAITGHGGWPLTIVMTPDKQPFFAGTYFPKSARYGRPGLMEILQQLQEKWQHDRNRILEASQQIVEAIRPRFQSVGAGELSTETLEKAFQQFSRQYDRQYGGFGQAPKFPSPHQYLYLLRYWKRTGNTKALEMVEKSLVSMYRGGMYDHIGFGFSRYSTDPYWLVPHFEKMLYDNALLTIAYAEAYQATGNSFYKQVVEQVLTYILRDMTSPEGGFYSAEDADSEEEEGKFYVWRPNEILDILGPEDGELFCDYYGITEQGNFEHQTSIPNLLETDLLTYHNHLGESREEWQTYLNGLRERVFAAREQRVHPHKDDKILTAWNGLMIAALAKASQAMQRADYAEAAERAYRFLTTHLQRADGRLLARYRDGQAAYPGYLDDYAFVIWGLLELYEATWNVQYLEDAIHLTQEMNRLFWDDEHGGYFFYGSDSETLFARPKEIYDGAMPSGNSVAALNLLRLARLTSDPALEERAQAQLQAFSGNVSRYPTGYAYFLMALDFALGPTQEVVLTGPMHSLQAMSQTVHTAFLPHTVVLVKPTDQKAAMNKIDQLVPAARDQAPIDDQATAYVCQNFSCHAPVTTLDALRLQLGLSF